MKNCSLEVGRSKEPENDNLNLRNRSEREKRDSWSGRELRKNWCEKWHKKFKKFAVSL